MKAVRVSDIFSYGWKRRNRNYKGREYEFVYDGVEWLPLEVVKDIGYLILDCDIENIEYIPLNEEED